MHRNELALAETRRIALAAQGFNRLRPSGRVTASHIARTIRRLGLVQLDFVTVLGPAHYQVLYSRLGPYARDLFDHVVYRRRQFTECWAHEASVVPVDTWPLLRHRMEQHCARPWGFDAIMQQHSQYVDRVLTEVRQRGALTAAELPDPEHVGRKLEASWYGTVPRAVLEAHFGRGILAVTKRHGNFARAYDLVERVIPAEHVERRIDPDQARRELLTIAARAHGVATLGDLADYWRMPVKDARPRIAELVAAGQLREVRVEGWRDAAYLHPEARLPKQIDACALVSPFDPLIWTRKRVARLFQFDYRMEVFVPQDKRRWGVYVLPFLLGDRLVARVDLKADRPTNRLLVLSAHIEPHADAPKVAPRLMTELKALSTWLGLDSVAVALKGNLARPLAAQRRV